MAVTAPTAPTDPTQATSTAPAETSSPTAPATPAVDPVTSSPQQFTPDEFAQKIRTKYPGAYDSLDNKTLTQKFVAKYPVYQSMLKPDTPPPPPQDQGFIQNLQNKADASVGNGPGSVVPVTAPDDTFKGKLQHLRQGLAQGVESVIVHPLQTAHSSVELPMDIMRATGTSPEFIGQHESDPEVQQQIQAARDRLTQQWQTAKANPYGTAGQLIGGGLITHGISELAGGAVRGTIGGVSSLADSGTGASDLAVGAAKSVQQAGEKAAATQEAAGQSNAAALKNYAAKVEKATQTVEEQKATAAKKVADWTSEQQLDHATQVAHLEAQQAADEQAANITHDQARTQAQQLYAKNVRDVGDIDSVQGELARKERAARLQVMRTVADQEDTAHKAASAQFNEVRQAIGPAEAPVSTLGDSVKAAVTKNIKGSQEKIPIFQDMLRRAQNSGEQAQLQQSVIKSQGLSGDYDSLPPERKATVDKIVADINAHSGAPPEPPATMSWDNWRGYSSELGRMLQDQNTPGDIRNALQDVKNHVDAVSQKMADDAGVGDQFQNAKKNWSIYKQVFHEPEGPSGSGSRVAKAFNAEDAFNATQPFLSKDEFTSSRARQMLVGDPNAGPGGYYNPEAGKIVDRLRAIRDAQENLPAGKIVEPPQLKPDAEPLDIRQIKLDAYQRMSDRLKYVDKWQVKLLAGVAGGIVRHALGGDLEQAISTGVGSGALVAAPLALGKLMDFPTFRDWVSKPRPRDFELLNKLQGADKIRVRDDITGQIISAFEAGQRMKISPEVQGFVGAKNVLKMGKAVLKAKQTASGMTGAQKVEAAAKGAGAAVGAAGAASTSQQQTQQQNQQSQQKQGAQQ